MSSSVRRALALSILAALPGCYDSSSVLDRTDGGVDASTPDAGFDGDVGPYLPIEPEPDPAPDERPTGPWMDVAPPPAGTVVLVPVGEPVALDDELDSAGAPTLAWSGSGWGAAWPGHFRTLDQDGLPASATVTTVDRYPSPTVLDFAVGRYALVIGSTSRGEDGAMRMAAFDRLGTMATALEEGPSDTNGARGSSSIGAEVGVGRLTDAHQWVIATTRQEPTGGSSVLVFAADDEMRQVGEPIVVATSESTGGVLVAGAKTRALVVWTNEENVMAQAVRGPPLVLDGAPFAVMPRGTIGTDVALFRDELSVATGDAFELRLSMVDPWAHTVTHGPVRIAPSTSQTGAPALAVAPERGFMVACWASAAGAGHGVTLQALGPDGTPWGAPLILTSIASLLPAVDCGWNGTDVVVLWWVAGGDDVHNAIMSQRVHPTFL